MHQDAYLKFLRIAAFFPCHNEKGQSLKKTNCKQSIYSFHFLVFRRRRVPLLCTLTRLNYLAHLEQIATDW